MVCGCLICSTSWLCNQTGYVITVGKGILHSMSRKQWLNTRSTTESELVGANNMSILTYRQVIYGSTRLSS